MNPHAAIFDMDGLLISSERISLTLFLQMGHEYKLGDLTALYMSILGTNDVTTRSTVIEALRDKTDPHQFISEFQQRYYCATTEQPVPVMPGAEDLLSHLQAMKVKTAVATSTSTNLALVKLKNCGLFEYFNCITGGDTVANGKPAPDIYLLSAEKLQVEPQSCIALEDSPNGVRAAVAAGMYTIQVPDLLPPDADLTRLGHQVVSSLADVTYLLSLNQT